MNEQGTPPPPVGTPLPDWTPRPWPPGTSMKGRFVTVELLDPERHADDLFAVAREDRDGRNWTYMPYGPFADKAAHRSWVEDMYAGKDPFLHAVIDNATGKAVGTLSFMRIQPEIGVIEIGHIVFSPRIQRTPGATETIWLMLTRAFDELGYRRCEWKCDSLNAPSRAAARRFGFRFEGIFRQATIYKGRNRDTAWFSIVDKEWPHLAPIYRQWLAPDNFDADGKQKTSLSKLTAQAVGAAWKERRPS